jgi:RecB family exonuclease
VKNGAPETDSLPLGPARRAAVTAALHAAASSDEYLSRLAGSQYGVLIDDLCRMGAWCDALEVSDTALACAAAQAGRDVGCVARIVYGARLQMRAAGFGPSQIQPGGETVQTVHCLDLATAFDALVVAGATQARAPRRLLDDLRGVGNARTGSIVAALLAAAYSHDRADLISALSLAPYRIDPGNLGAALSCVSAMAGRTALAAAVGELRGAQAREAALAAVSALDAARPDLESGHVSLAAAVGALEQAVSGYAERTDARLRDPQFSELLRSAASADRVWAAGPPELPPVLRVSSLLHSVGQVEVARGLSLIADGQTDEPSPCAIRLTDAPGAPVIWESFAQALEIAAEKSGAPESTRMQVVVGATLARAAADYVFAAASAAARRAWPQAEEASTFTAPPMTFSASRLNAYVKCPRRWFYDYMCEVLDDPPSLHAAYGRVVHDALESLHRQVRTPSNHEAPFILERLLRELDVAFGKARPDFDSQLEYEVSRCRARRMAEQYVRWLTLEAARAPMEIVHVELLQRQRFGGHDFVGYIDRIDRPVGGGPVTIYDYKTGRIDSNPREYLAKVRQGDEAQLALYYAMRRAGGDEIARIALVSIRDPRDDAWILALDIIDDDGKAVVEREAHDGVLRASSSRADLDMALAALIARCDFLTQVGLAHFPVGEDPPCNFCAYARACRERPRDGERIFAR